MPGTLASTSLSGPIFFICRIWPSMSFRSMPLCIIFRAACCAFLRSRFFWASSISVSTSPMPRMREAIRSGWKTSKSESFSPVPANLMGLPVTARTERAAPPRASPSSLVRTTPVMSSRSLNDFATFTASCPVMASTTSRMSVGRTAARMFLSSPISFSSICSRPAVSISTMSLP